MMSGTISGGLLASKMASDILIPSYLVSCELWVLWHPLVAKLTNIEWCSKVLGIGNYVRNNICFGCKPLKWPQAASYLVFWYRGVTFSTLAPPSEKNKQH